MFTRCVRNILSRSAFTVTLKWHSWRHCSTSQTETVDQVTTLLQLCVDRFFVSPGHANVELFQRGLCCSYGPLGMELRRNLLDQWWHSVTRSGAQVFGINTLSSSSSSSREAPTGGQGQLRIVECEQLKQRLGQKQLSKGRLAEEVHMLLQRSPSLRTNLLQGKLLHTPVINNDDNRA